jgi:hypothetical protein
VPLRPVLDFSFRFQAGYVVRVPLNQYHGAGHHWIVITQVQAESGGQPVYFLDRLNLPSIPESNAVGEAGGGYVLGEGSYRVLFALVDDQGRVCRAEWKIDAALGVGARSVKMAVKPGTIDEISLRTARSVQASNTPPIGRLTVLLHAAPVSPRASKVQANDAVILLGALASLLDLAPARSVRLVVFSLDQQKEIYRQENFTVDQLGAVRQALFDLQLATVDYRQLQNPTGSADLLKRLANEEIQSSNPSDAVVFLGPQARSTENPPVEARRVGPRFFYVEYRALRRGQPSNSSRDEFAGVGTSIERQREEAGSPADIGGSGRYVIPKQTQIDGIDGPSGSSAPRDSIDYLVGKLKGKTLVVSTPSGFAKAIEQVTAVKTK